MRGLGIALQASLRRCLDFVSCTENSERPKELLAKRAHFLHKGTANLPTDEICYRGAHDWKTEKAAS